MATRQQQVERHLRGLDALVEAPSMFSEANAWWVNGKEVAHFHGPDELEIRLTKAVIRDRRAELRADNRVTLRPNTSDWITVTVRAAKDVAFVVELVEIAAAAHQPLPGQTAKAPPSGADLVRRKRFH